MPQEGQFTWTFYCIDKTASAWTTRTSYDTSSEEYKRKHWAKFRPFKLALGQTTDIFPSNMGVQIISRMVSKVSHSQGIRHHQLIPTTMKSARWSGCICRWWSLEFHKPWPKGEYQLLDSVKHHLFHHKILDKHQYRRYLCFARKESALSNGYPS